MQRRLRVRLSSLSLVAIWLCATWTRPRSSLGDHSTATYQTLTTTTAMSSVSTSPAAQDAALQQRHSVAGWASSEGATADRTADPAHAQLLKLGACTLDAASSEPVSTEDVINGTAPRRVCPARLPRVTSFTRIGSCPTVGDGPGP